MVAFVTALGTTAMIAQPAQIVSGSPRASSTSDTPIELELAGIHAHDRAPELTSRIKGHLDLLRRRVKTTGGEQVEVAVVVEVDELPPAIRAYNGFRALILAVMRRPAFLNMLVTYRSWFWSLS